MTSRGLLIVQALGLGLALAALTLGLFGLHTAEADPGIIYVDTAEHLSLDLGGSPRPFDHPRAYTGNGTPPIVIGVASAQSGPLSSLG